MYDAIVVGARVAGSPTAMLLARQGHRVLLLDRASFPSETISTHLMHPRGASYLKRWGVLEGALALAPSWTRITVTREGLAVTGTQPLEALRSRLQALHGFGADEDAALMWFAPRRKAFDAFLAAEAVSSGAEFRDGCVVEDLAMEQDRVCGVRGRTTSGGRFEERARIVVGADGRHSSVARALRLKPYNTRQRCTFAYYTYWTGFSLDGAQWPTHFRGRLGLSVYPTGDGLIHLVVFGPDEWFARFRGDVEGNYLRVVDFVAPSLGETLRTAGRRAERTYGTVDQPHYFHPPRGPGWALVGDAGYNKDQCTAIGMMHAVRDADLLATAIHGWLSGEQSEEDALEEYARVRDAEALEYYDFVARVAEMRPAKLEQLRILAALQGNQREIDRLLGVSGDVVPAGEYYSAENVAAILSAGPDLDPSFASDYDSRLRCHADPPF